MTVSNSKNLVGPRKGLGEVQRYYNSMHALLEIAAENSYSHLVSLIDLDSKSNEISRYLDTEIAKRTTLRDGLMDIEEIHDK